jgi:hypothetical protein
MAKCCIHVIQLDSANPEPRPNPRLFPFNEIVLLQSRITVFDVAVAEKQCSMPLNENTFFLSEPSDRSHFVLNFCAWVRSLRSGFPQNKLIILICLFEHSSDVPCASPDTSA